MNLKPPPVFLRIPSTTQAIHSIKPQNIVCLVDRVRPEVETEVHHKVADRSMFFVTSLTSQEIEEGMSSLLEQQAAYDNEYFNLNFLGDSE
jgi:type III secretory pathway component EscV